MESGHNAMEQMLLKTKYLLGHSQFSTNCEPALPLDLAWSSSCSHSKTITEALIFKNIQSKKNLKLNDCIKNMRFQTLNTNSSCDAEIVTYFGSLSDTNVKILNISNTGVTKQD